MTKCPICKQPATQKFGLKLFCGYEHAAAWAKSSLDKRKAREKTRARKVDREKLKSLKTRSEWLKELQVVFNKFIRLRDAGLPCISCGTPEWEIIAGTPINQVGGIWDAGHYLSRGAYPELRFDEANCHKQCKRCNGGSGKFAAKNKTVTQRYRENLINKIGQAEVDRLEGKHEPLKLTIPEIQTLITEYKAKVKALTGRICSTK